MKIGILTFHLAHNYGAVLQCYALQETLCSMGYDAQVIDYQQPFLVEHFRPKRYWGVRSFVEALVHGNMQEYIYNARIPYIKSRNFRQFRELYLRLTAPCYGLDDIPPMDFYIIGSDQPWNPDLTAGADPVYYGQFKRPASSKLITYAMSGSEKAIGKVGWETVRQCCDNFSSLSFREESLSKRISGLTGRRCETVLDPTLIADAELWQPLVNTKWQSRKYVLLYHVGGPKEIIDTMTCKAKQLAAEQGIEFIDLSRYLYSPSDFVSLIRYARYVITASFHAMVFSIIFKRPFYVVRTGQASDIRFQNLLPQLGLEKQLVAVEDIKIPKVEEYDKAKINLAEMAKSSIAYLKQQCE